MRDPRMELRLLSEENLTDLLDAAVTDAEPAEVMPALPGPPGWTDDRRRAFRDFHRSRSIGTAEPVETTYVIALENRVIGAARLERSGNRVEMGVWIGRSQRGRGIGRLVTTELLTLARRTDAERIIASTTPGNTAAQQLLRGIGATLTTTGDVVYATLSARHAPPIADYMDACARSTPPTHGHMDACAPASPSGLSLRIPRYLAEVAARADCGDLRAWVAILPEVVADLAQRWALQVGQPYEPGGQCSWVAPARTVTGDDLVLKVGWRHPDTAQEADALRMWRGDGAVRLHATETFDSTIALLLERCTPGTPLNQLTPEPEQDVVLAGLLRRLWAQPSDDHPFRYLRVMCEDWAAEFEERFTHSAGAIDPGIARAAMVLFRELPRSAGSTALLCTDLHAGNVLAAQRQPWLVIDPNPYVGDRTYDALQHMLNCEERLAADPVGFARRMAGLLDLDAARLRLWLFARCVQECLEQPVLYEVAVRLAP